MQCGAVKVISASVWCLWSWDFPVCVAYNVFYAPHKLLGPYLQLALFSPSLRTCNSWPFSLVNYLHVKQWIKMMALRKMLLILRKKKKKKAHFFLKSPSWGLFVLPTLRRRHFPFPHSCSICTGKCFLPLILKYPLDILGMGWEDVSLMFFWKWKTMKERKGRCVKQPKLLQKSQTGGDSSRAGNV